MRPVRVAGLDKARLGYAKSTKRAFKKEFEMNPAKKGTKMYELIARRQVLEVLGRKLIGNPAHVFTEQDYAAIDDAEQALRRNHKRLWVFRYAPEGDK